MKSGKRFAIAVSIVHDIPAAAYKVVAVAIGEVRNAAAVAETTIAVPVARERSCISKQITNRVRRALVASTIFDTGGVTESTLVRLSGDQASERGGTLGATAADLADTSKSMPETHAVPQFMGIGKVSASKDAAKSDEAPSSFKCACLHREGGGSQQDIGGKGLHSKYVEGILGSGGTNHGILICIKIKTVDAVGVGRIEALVLLTTSTRVAAITAIPVVNCKVAFKLANTVAFLVGGAS